MKPRWEVSAQARSGFAVCQPAASRSGGRKGRSRSTPGLVTDMPSKSKALAAGKELELSCYIKNQYVFCIPVLIIQMKFLNSNPEATGVPSSARRVPAHALCESPP